MQYERLLSLLEQTAEKLSIRIDYDDLQKGEVSTPGGFFKLRGEKYILIHRDLSVKEKVDLLCRILAEMDTENTHLPPEIRERIERVRHRGTSQQ